ncbi:unannotated protein [freshwater metagenome]|uniref:Unannotated protein n=1 Tax=freshwater metagenome TaxID=449393 RepID=A0A6J7NVC9_9ZZZZ
MFGIFDLLQIEPFGVFAVAVAPRTHAQLQIDHSLGTAVVVERQRGFGIAPIHVTQGGEPSVVEFFKVEVDVFLSGAQPPETSENFPFGDVAFRRVE